MACRVTGAKRWVLSAGLGAAVLLGCGDESAFAPVTDDDTSIGQVQDESAILMAPARDTEESGYVEPVEQTLASPVGVGSSRQVEMPRVEKALLDLLRDLLGTEEVEDFYYRRPPRTVPMIGSGPCGDCRWGARIREQLAVQLDTSSEDIRLTLEARSDQVLSQAEVVDHAVVCSSAGDCALVVEIDAISAEGFAEQAAESLDRVSWRLSFVDEQPGQPSSQSWTLDLMPLGLNDRMEAEDGPAVAAQDVARSDTPRGRSRPSRPQSAQDIERPDSPTVGGDR